MAGCTWDTVVTGAGRFQVLAAFNDEAVLDTQTGLVWERRPDTQQVEWEFARLACAQKAVGGQGGWRLPSFDELATLFRSGATDPSSPALPELHPFLDVQPGVYWSITLFRNHPVPP